jgi:hypothetical protein
MFDVRFLDIAGQPPTQRLWKPRINVTPCEQLKVALARDPVRQRAWSKRTGPIVSTLGWDVTRHKKPMGSPS